MASNRQSVQIFSALSVQAAFHDGLIAAIEALGVDPQIEWNPTTLIEKKIANGIIPDIVIVTDEAVKSLINDNIVAAKDCYPLVDSLLGIAVRKGRPQPDISTVDKCFETFLNSRSIAYSRSGASGIHMQQVWRKAGLLELINRRATIVAGGLVAETLVTGEADIAIQQLSELACVPDVDIVGPLPVEIQPTLSFSAAICGASSQREAARKIVDLLTSPPAKAIYERNGLTFRQN